MSYSIIKQRKIGCFSDCQNCYFSLTVKFYENMSAMQYSKLKSVLDKCKMKCVTDW